MHRNLKELLAQLRAVIWRKSIVCAVAMLIIYTVICGIKAPALIPVGIGITALYLAASLIMFRRDLRAGGLTSDNGAILGITLDFVTKFRYPAFIVNADGIINWYNAAFITTTEARRSLYGKSAAEVISASFTPARIEQLSSGATFTLEYDGTGYEVSGYALVSGGKSYCMIVMNDISALIDARQKLAEKNVVVAFLILDNINESLQFSQDKYRSVSAHAAGLISEWVRAAGGMTKEYDRDKYIIVFEEKALPAILAAKFDILDKIRETEIDTVTVPITASIGISCIPGTLAEKEASARGALELALQRGGDQAVLRTASSTEYYGGRTKTVQKKTKIRSRVIAAELTELIRKSGNVMIMGHRFSDHDSIASCVAIARIAACCGKTAKIAVNLHDANLKAVFSKMRGLTYYSDLFIDAPTAQDMLRSDTLLIICDVNNPDLFEARELYENCVNFAVIDHHRKIQEDGGIEPKLSYIEPSASSTSELVSEIVEYAVPQGSLTKIEAELLFAGIILDTNNFSKKTGVGTFGAALFLRSQGADPSEAQSFFKANLDDFLYEADIEKNISIYRDRIMIACTDAESNNPSQIKLVASRSANRLLGIAGIEASFVLSVIGRDVSISGRSAGKLNVQLILESLGGGGHFDAAGALVRDTSLDGAQRMLKDAIDRYLGEKEP